MGAMGLSKQECKEPEGHFSLAIGRTIIMSKKKEIDRHGELGTRMPKTERYPPYSLPYRVNSVTYLIRLVSPSNVYGKQDLFFEFRLADRA